MINILKSNKIVTRRFLFMKKHCAILVLSAIAYNCSAQTNHYYPIPIQHDTAIQWAAECDKIINLSPKINEYSLKKWYLDKLIKSTVNAYTAIGSKLVSSYSLSLPGLEKQDWLKGLNVELPQYRNPKEWYFADNTKSKDDYERVKYRGGVLNFSADSCCGCDEADAFRVKQILNYKHGRFSIYNVFISPLCARQTATAPFDWYPLCNVAYNDNIERKFPGPSKDVVLLNTNEVDYNFDPKSPLADDSVLTVNGTDIGSLIYQDILKGNLKPVDIETGKQVSTKNFLTWKMPADTMSVIDADDISKITAYKVIQQERSSRDFNRIRIKQDLYFDFKNERLYSVIRSVTLMMAVKSHSGIMLGYTPFCRIN